MASVNAIFMLTIALLATVLLINVTAEEIPCGDVWLPRVCRQMSHQGNEFLCHSKLERGKALRAACKMTCHMCGPSTTPTEMDMAADFPKLNALYESDEFSS